MAAWEKELLTNEAPAELPLKPPLRLPPRAKPPSPQGRVMLYDGKCLNERFPSSWVSKNFSRRIINGSNYRRTDQAGREDTGAGMLDVKKALTEAEGDVARAKEIIRARVSPQRASVKAARSGRHHRLQGRRDRQWRDRLRRRAELRDRLRGQDPEVRRVHRGSSRYAVDADANSA